MSGEMNKAEVDALREVRTGGLVDNVHLDRFVRRWPGQVGARETIDIGAGGHSRTRNGRGAKHTSDGSNRGMNEGKH